jgi:hypothetical protein
MMVEEDEDEFPHVNMDENDEEVQDTCLAFDDDLDSEVNDFTIEEDDCIFMAMVHLVDPHHFVHASSMVSRCLVEAFAKNSKPKGFEDIVVRGHLSVSLLPVSSPTLHLPICILPLHLCTIPKDHTHS